MAGRPVASFTFTPTSGTAVNFTDTSSNSPTSWAWNFGDGGTSTAQNPTHTFATAGVYTISMTAKNANGLGVGFAMGGGLAYSGDDATRPGDITAGATLGAQYFRYDWVGPGTETKYAQVVDQLAAGGIQTVALITGISTTSFQTTCQNFATTMIPHGVTVYELWNEQNRPANGMVNAADYTNRVLIPGYIGLKAAATALGTPITVLMGGLSPGGGANDPRTWVQGIYAAGGKAYFDAANVHPYTCPNVPTTPGDTNAFLQVQAIRDTMVANGDGGKLIWATELGWPTAGTDGRQVSEATQASMATAFVSDWVSYYGQFAGPVLWYSLRDNASQADSEAHFGVQRSDLSHKPAWATIQTAYASVAVPLGSPTSQSITVGNAGGGHAQNVLALSPKLFLRLGETSGTTAVDSSGLGRNGTYGSGVTLGVTDSTIGDGNTAITCPNTTAVAATVPNNSDFTLGLGSAQRWSIEFLHRPNAETTSFPSVVGNGNGITAGSFQIFYSVGSTALAFKFNNLSSGYSSAVANDNTWRHFVLTWDGTNLVWYTNNSAASSTPTQTAATANATALTVGSGAIGTTTKASLDEFAIYNVALTSTQVGMLYSSLGNAALLPAPANLRSTAITSTSVSLAWDAVTGASGYEISVT